jgi:hypothetical protein
MRNDVGADILHNANYASDNNMQQLQHQNMQREHSRALSLCTCKFGELCSQKQRRSAQQQTAELAINRFSADHRTKIGKFDTAKGYILALKFNL